MIRLVDFALPMPEDLARKHATILRGPNHCFHDSFHLACKYSEFALVLGFIHADSEIYPHAWINSGGVDIDPTNFERGPRIALHQWSHEDCRRHVAASPLATLQVGELVRAVVPPRVNRAGDIVFTEIDVHGKECLNQVDTARAALLRLDLLAMI